MAELHRRPPRLRPPPPAGAVPPAYAELHCLTNFSFQRGASHPHELVERAQALGYSALAITDECSVAGVVRAHLGLRDHLAERAPGGAPLRLLFGSEFAFPEAGFRLVALARDLDGWGNLCEFITAARRGGAAKGDYRVGLDCSDFRLLRGCEILCVPDRLPADAIDSIAIRQRISKASALFDEKIWIAAELHRQMDDALWLAVLQDAGAACGLPLLAAGDVHMHRRSRKRLQDVLTAVRQGRSVADCGFALQPSAERHLRPREQLAELYPPELLANTLEAARRCRFDLDEIKPRYQYPHENVPGGEAPMQTLTRLTWAGAARRYPDEVPAQVQASIAKELALIGELDYAMFFLTVEDIVRFARSQNILCQGRGSAANSTVCYCLGITAVNPVNGHLLFERFVSRERREPPDIDVDFEHQRREEVIQYIYAKYGRERAAIAAVVICWRTRSALRDVGKALGVPAALVDEFAKDHYWFDDGLQTERLPEALERTGLSVAPGLLALWLGLTAQLKGFPRHLSQHVGGFVLTQSKLTRLVPVENASMKERSVVQWEKDDLEAMHMIKVDVLALGMLSALRRGLDLVNRWRGTHWALHNLPAEDPATYDMICAADTVGVFQIESRAQMSMLPRLQPRTYYDLVVEVAIVRPGPIQGGMVHPYLRQRVRERKKEKIEYEYPDLNEALKRTLGVPIFQEQVMQIAMLAAKFTADEADRLRRSMAAWKRTAGISAFRDKLIDGMEANGYARSFAERLFKQIEGFGEYGFPESHAASFAQLVYVSSWLKCHEPAAFLAALLDSQPMGFYSPSQLVQDARRHGVEVRPVDVCASGWDCTLEPAAQDSAQPAVRLGLRLVGQLDKAAAQRLLDARATAPFISTEDLALRARLDPADLRALAAADALLPLSGHRRQQVWDASAQRRAPALWQGVPVDEAPLALPQAREGEEISGDYAALGLTLRRHPLALLRPRMARMQLLTARQLHTVPHGRSVRACGIVTMRQRPPTAKGTLFVTLEDETGVVNIIVWQHVLEAQREPLLKSRLLAVEGQWQCSEAEEGAGVVRHLLARRCKDLSALLGALDGESLRSRDFH
ncbi:error-prone DNA polymerase [Xylophilus sp. ASV27]|uniref:error-prone DNA polymerase n=1 Tax=Xylophilus sp. ASV27 TaxID=2795129 RepID=UPI0018EA85F8|nr:error-prone DNA polymerase [Xylophilus sp. ASV27]